MIPHGEFLARRFLALRRVALFASVAGLGIAALAGGASNSSAWISPAVAAETAAQPAGFADVVEKVRPAVISVRVDATTQRTVMNEDGDNAMQFRQGSPFERFFRRFGFNEMPNGMQDWPRDGRLPGLRRWPPKGRGFSFRPTVMQSPIIM